MKFSSSPVKTPRVPPMLQSRGPMDAKHRNFVLIACICLALAALTVYSRAARNPFLHVDDQNYVTENPHVQAGVAWQTFTWALTATIAENWHPLTWLSHALDCQLYGLNPVGHHATNILLHALNAVLLFLLLLRATGARGRSLLVAALFALHPLNVESVAWIAERKNVLSTLFFLLTLAAYGWYARKPEVKRYLAVVALFALGLAAKPMVITLPFVLMLLDYWPLERIRGKNPRSSSTPKVGKHRQKSRVDDGAAEKALPVPQFPFSRLILEKLPLLILCAGSAAITIVAQRTPRHSVLRDISVWWKARKRPLLLRILRLENFLARASRISISLSKRRPACVARRISTAFSFSCECSRLETAPYSPIPCDRLALVSRNLDTCNRSRSGR